VLFSEGEELGQRWLQRPEAHRAPEEPVPGPAPGDLCLPLDGSMSIDQMDRAIIGAALQRTQGNVTAAARLLGTTRQTLRYRIEKHGLVAKDES